MFKDICMKEFYTEIFNFNLKKFLLKNPSSYKHISFSSTKNVLLGVYSESLFLIQKMWWQYIVWDTYMILITSK